MLRKYNIGFSFQTQKHEFFIATSVITLNHCKILEINIAHFVKGVPPEYCKNLEF